MRSVARGFWFGVGEALLVPLAFAALGFAWWGTAARAQAGSTVYAPAMAPEGEIWLVDGFNVVQVALLSGRERDAWWTAPRREELLERVAAFEVPAAEVWVVFDGERPAEAASAVRTVFAPSADDWLLRRVREAPDPSLVHVVTADRRLAARGASPGGTRGLAGGLPPALSGPKRRSHE